MTLLTPIEEILAVSWGDLGDVSFYPPAYYKLMLTAENLIVGLQAVSYAQLRKVLTELEALEPFDHDTWNFGVAVRKWREAARKEAGC